MSLGVGNRNATHVRRHGAQCPKDFRRETGPPLPLAFGAHHCGDAAGLEGEEAAFVGHQDAPEDLPFPGEYLGGKLELAEGDVEEIAISAGFHGIKIGLVVFYIITYNLLDLDQYLLYQMIICRLSTILGARRLKVSDVCRATGIARATLDRYYYDKVKSFDRDVLARLCQFLQIKPGDLLVEVEQADLFGLPTAQDGEIS